MTLHLQIAGCASLGTGLGCGPVSDGGADDVLELIATMPTSSSSPSVGATSPTHGLADDVMTSGLVRVHTQRGERGEGWSEK